jgi:E3 ubiquitin-protein ligase MYCBP2
MHLSCAEKVYQMASKVKKIELPKCLYPGCRALPEHPEIERLAVSWRPLRDAIEIMLPRVIADEGLEREKDHVNNPECEEYFHKPLDYARDLFLWFMCEKCHNPFYGGNKNCEDDGNPVANYVCVACSRLLIDTYCRIHGDDQMLYKCFWCCKPALFFCGGAVHYCADCHSRAGQVTNGPWPQCDGKCQFAPHAPNGTPKIVGYCATCEAERARRRSEK